MAVMKDNTLEDYYISLRKEAWTPAKKEKILTIIKSWLTTYKITNVALAKPYENQSTQQIKELLESVKTLINEQEISVHTYDHQTIYLFCESDQSKTKKNAMKELSRHYPELSRHYQKEMRNKNKYYVKLFEAVALANVHSKELQQRQ